MAFFTFSKEMTHFLLDGLFSLLFARTLVKNLLSRRLSVSLRDFENVYGRGRFSWLYEKIYNTFQLDSGSKFIFVMGLILGFSEMLGKIGLKWSTAAWAQPIVQFFAPWVLLIAVICLTVAFFSTLYSALWISPTLHDRQVYAFTNELPTESAKTYWQELTQKRRKLSGKYWCRKEIEHRKVLKDIERRKVLARAQASEDESGLVVDESSTRTPDAIHASNLDTQMPIIPSISSQCDKADQRWVQSIKEDMSKINAAIPEVHSPHSQKAVNVAFLKRCHRLLTQFYHAQDEGLLSADSRLKMPKKEIAASYVFRIFHLLKIQLDDDQSLVALQSAMEKFKITDIDTVDLRKAWQVLECAESRRRRSVSLHDDTARRSPVSSHDGTAVNEWASHAEGSTSSESSRENSRENSPTDAMLRNSSGF